MIKNVLNSGSGICSSCRHSALKPFEIGNRQVYCSFECLLAGERPHIFFDKNYGEWKTCAAISVAAHKHMQLFASLGFSMGDYYMQLSKRYIDARIFVIAKNTQQQYIPRVKSNELLLSH